MMSQAHEYREKAERCRKMTDKVISPMDKEMWLQLAADWSQLASLRERSAIERADTTERNREH